ncbi:MAG: hypothetical protein JNL21_27410 [Myxococcales bacterium]|nr:hypothetical protein [Myxococcales bacterium]
MVIAVSALAIGIDRFVRGGLAAMSASAPGLFLVLCGAFILIAVLGLAITPAEKQLIERHTPGLADFGGAMAVLGHSGTIAYFSWWTLYRLGLCVTEPELANRLAPIQLGVMFELVFVGAWVWIIAWAVARHRVLPRGFFWLSVVKAVCFWFTFVAFLLNVTWMLVVGLGATALVVGPAWHLWIARLFPRDGAPSEARHG